MFRSALRELKFHPVRYVAVILAIAISVGFLAAASVITATESHSMANQMAAPYSKTDLVLSFGLKPQSASDPGDVTTASMTADINAVEGVAKAEPVLTSDLVAEKGSITERLAIVAAPSEEFRWAKLLEGSWPAPGEIVLNKTAANALGLKVGDTLSAAPFTLTISGISDEPAGAIMGNPAIVNRSWFLESVGDSWVWGTKWVLDMAPGADVDTVKDVLSKALTTDWATPLVSTQKEYQTKTVTNLTGVDVMKYILWVFAGIAMVVGMITIANTFTILLVQRRRQTGLLRAVGASGKQVRHSVWAEALILGFVGSILGVAFACALAAGVGLYTGSIHFGIVVPLRDMLIAVGLGVVITFIACVVPARRATQVPPIEALQLASPEATRKVGVARAIICGLFVVAGAGLAVLSLQQHKAALPLAIVGAMALSIGVLFGGRLFVPGLLKAAGLLVKRMGPSAATAAKNVVRDPARASATATALMLAVGLIITLQVGAASMKETTMAKLDEEYPIQLYTLALPATSGSIDLNRADLDRVAKLAGVESVLEIACRQVSAAEGEYKVELRVCKYVPGIAAIAPGLQSTMADDAILMAGGDGTTSLSLPGVDGPIALTEVPSTATSWSYSFVSPATYDKLTGESYAASLAFIQIAKNAEVMKLASGVKEVFGSENSRAEVGGSVFERYTIETVINIMISIGTALLGVAVLIALVGVSNTLTLSVIERTRENAILRALGFQRRQLKIMLLVEAILLTLAGALVGLIAGAFFGWLGSTAVVNQMLGEGLVMETRFAIDLPQTLGLLGVLVLAAVLASLLPGRRAAKASPVEALAEV